MREKGKQNCHGVNVIREKKEKKKEGIHATGNVERTLGKNGVERRNGEGRRKRESGPNKRPTQHVILIPTKIPHYKKN